MIYALVFWLSATSFQIIQTDLSHDTCHYMEYNINIKEQDKVVSCIGMGRVI